MTDFGSSTTGSLPTTGGETTDVVEPTTSSSSSSTSSDTSTGPGLPDTSETGDDSTSGTTGSTGESSSTGEPAVVASVTISPAGTQVEVGMLGALSASVLDGEGQPIADAAISWYSSDGLIAYVDGEGELLGVRAGEATIVAEADGVVSSPVTVTVVAFDPPAATFNAVLALTSNRCAVDGCHIDGSEAGGLRLDREAVNQHEELVGEQATGAPLWLVRPNQPQQSYLVHKLALRSPQAGVRMPFAAAPLPAAEAQVIVRWVLDGAPLN